MLCTLIIVNLLSRKQKQQVIRRQQQRQLRLKIEELGDLVGCLDSTLPNRTITQLFNQRLIAQLKTLLDIEKNNKAYIEVAIQKAEAHSARLLNPNEHPTISYQKDSDTQIAQTQTYLKAALALLPQLVAQGLIDETELIAITQELRWAHLMVGAMSLIEQGRKAMASSDRFTAYEFYRKAQQQLLESFHQDSKRLTLIKELSQLIDGSRTSLSNEFDSPSLTPLQ